MHHLSNESELDKVGTDTGVKARMMRGEGGVLQELVSLCQQAVAADGSEAVLLGCTCMAPVAFELERRLDFAVLDPSRIGLVAAHAAARTHRGRAADGRAPSAVRHTGLARRLVSDHLAAQESQAVALDDCEVCVVTPGSALESERQG